jgi:hypothetical protein
MILRLKYLYYFLIELLKENPIKIIFTIVSLVAFYFALNFPDLKKEIKIEKVIKVESGWVYLYQKIDENKIKYETIYSPEELSLKSGVLVISKHNEVNLLFFFLSIGSFITVIIGTFDGSGWEIKHVKYCTIGRLIICEYENNKFYYTICGRLIGTSDRQYNNYKNICLNFHINSLNDILICPKFETKRGKRERILSKLGIQ